MTTVTLELPEELAQKLEQLDQAEIIEALEKALVSHKEERMKIFPSAPLPEKTFKISREAWHQRLLKISAWDQETLHDIEAAKEYIDQWQPKTFS